MIEQLENIFFGKELIILTKNENPVTPKKSRNILLEQPVDLTPVSKSIYDTLTPISQDKMRQDFIRNDIVVETLEEKQYELDPDYQEKFENGGLGFYLENYISYYGLCPVCGEKTLCKYRSSNVPVVDLVCINTDYHLSENKCFLFQVKISLNNSYFNLDHKKISGGSIKYGEIPHTLEGTSDTNKKYLIPGYICLRLEEHTTDIQTYLINHNASFVLIPDLNNKSNQFYYQYLQDKNFFGKNLITWNGSMVSTKPLNTVLNGGRIKEYVFNEEVIDNPYQQLLQKN
jgi:hypothetical protein